MADLDFSAAVADWVKQSKEAVEAVFHRSADLVGEAVMQGTPIDTGFLVHSFQASASEMPSIKKGSKPNVNAGPGSYTFDKGPINLVIQGVPLGNPIYLGFTAEYAPYVEYGANGRAGRGMVRLAAQRWQGIVNQAVGELRAASGK